MTRHPAKKKPGTSAPTKETPQRQRDLRHSAHGGCAAARHKQSDTTVAGSHTSIGTEMAKCSHLNGQVAGGVKLASRKESIRHVLRHVVASPDGPVLVRASEKGAC